MEADGWRVKVGGGEAAGLILKRKRVGGAAGFGDQKKQNSENYGFSNELEPNSAHMKPRIFCYILMFRPECCDN